MTAAIGTLPRVGGANDEQRSLVLAAAAGDAVAFNSLYGRYARSVFNMVLRSVRHQETAEDIAQEVWIKAHRDLGRLRDPMAFPAWLFQIVAKACVDAARKRTRAPILTTLSEEMAARSHDPEAAAIDDDDTQVAWESLALLPAHQHLGLFLREVEGRSYREIAGILGISETAVGLCLLRARRSFARIYERLEDASQLERCDRMHLNSRASSTGKPRRCNVAR